MKKQTIDELARELTVKWLRDELKKYKEIDVLGDEDFISAEDFIDYIETGKIFNDGLRPYRRKNHV